MVTVYETFFAILITSLFSITFDAGWVRQVDTNAFARTLTYTTGMMGPAIAYVMRLASGNTPPGRSMNVSKDEFAAAISNRPFSTAPFGVSALPQSYRPALRPHTLSFRVSENNHTRASSCCSAPFPLQKTK
jgi:hypothetical protein